MSDLVIDTNVFAHTGNPNIAEHVSAMALCAALAKTELAISTDPGFSFVEASNLSKIGHEYLTHIPATCLGYFVLVELAQNQRLKQRSRKVATAARHAIDELVHDVSDRVFVRVALNTELRVLISNDHAGYPLNTRKELSRRISVNVHASNETDVSSL